MWTQQKYFLLEIVKEYWALNDFQAESGELLAREQLSLLHLFSLSLVGGMETLDRPKHENSRASAQARLFPG